MARFGWSSCVVWLAAAPCVACGDESESEDTGQVGHLGAFSFTVEAVDPATPGADGRTCPMTGTFGFGDPPPTSTMQGGVVDASNGRGIFCIVAPMGASFYVDVSAASDANTEKAVSLQILDDAVDATSGSIEASIVVKTPATGILVDDEPCTIAPPRTIVPGEIVANFTCPLLRPLTSDATACAAHGTIAFRDCDAALDD